MWLHGSVKTDDTQGEAALCSGYKAAISWIAFYLSCLFIRFKQINAHSYVCNTITAVFILFQVDWSLLMYLKYFVMMFGWFVDPYQCVSFRLF